MKLHGGVSNGSAASDEATVDIAANDINEVVVDIAADDIIVDKHAGAIDCNEWHQFWQEPRV